MALKTALDSFWKKLTAKPRVIWMLWILVGIAVLWAKQSQYWSSTQLVSEAVRHWEGQLPMLIEQMEEWKQNPKAVRGSWDEVFWDKDGCRVYWKGNDLSSSDDKILQNLKEDAWVPIRSGSGLAFVHSSSSGKRVAFVRLEHRYNLTTSTMPMGMLIPFAGGENLRIIPSNQSVDGRPVRDRDKVWFRIQARSSSMVVQPINQWIFHSLVAVWLILGALLVKWPHSKPWFGWGIWIIGAVMGNLWLWDSKFRNLRFFELGDGDFWHYWSQARILFNVLWMSLGAGFLVYSRSNSGKSIHDSRIANLNRWWFWGAWLGLVLAWVFILDAGKVKIGWANPMTWSVDDAIWILSLVVLMILAVKLVTKIEGVQAFRRRVVFGGSTLISLGVLVFGIDQGWTIWGWMLAAGCGAWFGWAWLWRRFSRTPSGRNFVLALMGLWCSLLIYAQHWRIQVSSAQVQLATLVEPRPLEAYTYFDSFIDSLREDATWLDTTLSKSLDERSRFILDKHYANLSPFFDLLSSQRIPNTLDSSEFPLLSNPEFLGWKGSVQEFQNKGRNAYRLKIVVGGSQPMPDTLLVILAQKFFPNFSPIPSILGTGPSWSNLPGRSGLALYENGTLIFQNGTYTYPFLLPEGWMNSIDSGIKFKDARNTGFNLIQKFIGTVSKSDQMNPWNWVIGQDLRPILTFRKDHSQVAVQVLEMPSMMMPLALGALLTMVMWWFLRLPISSIRNNLWSLTQWSALRLQAKVQWATTFLVVLIIAALVGFTIFFITRQYRNETQTSLLAQLRQFHLMSQTLVSTEGALSDHVVRTMRDRAALNDIDFFLYDADGRFRAGSRDLWFERGLVSDYMPHSIWNSFGKGLFQFQLTEERIGQVDYLSAFHTLRNDQGQLLGFVNLPFVNKAPRGAPELNEYLAGVISVFTLVLLLAMLIAYRLAKGIASPVQVLTKAMLQAKSGRKITLNEQMSGGEFGLLLKSYNQMVQSLSEHEKRLAEAERNTAWKEMARQIAHDIKNPLTPMKLRLQKLLRDYRDNPTSFDTKFESDTQSVLQQIDLLTEIADTYRDFSKESEADKSPILWYEFLQNVAGWYAEQCVMDWKVQPEAMMVRIHGQSSRLQRVLQNLLQNAIQAQRENSVVAQVAFNLSLVDGSIQLELVDQGMGISQERQEHLFEINFTTRSEGLGLGLAMSRKIVEQHGGSLHLCYSDDRGTSFMWTMPVYDLNSDCSDS